MQQSKFSRNRPGGAIASRPLHFIWLCDCSGSMGVMGKIQSLNTAIKEAIPILQQTAADNPNAQVLVRAIKFSDGADWHILEPTPVEQVRWRDLGSNGATDMGEALCKVAEQLKVPPMSERALPPVLVLISDGLPSDDFNSGLQALMAQDWGQKAVRVAIAVGRDANHQILQKFIGNPEIRVLQANNPDQMVNLIKWTSTLVKAVSQPRLEKTNRENPMVIVQPHEEPGDTQEILMW